MRADLVTIDEWHVSTRRSCSCIGHFFPNVEHIAPCCDEVHITQEEFDKGVEFKHAAIEYLKDFDLDIPIKPSIINYPKQM